MFPQLVRVSNSDALVASLGLACSYGPFKYASPRLATITDGSETSSERAQCELRTIGTEGVALQAVARMVADVLPGGHIQRYPAEVCLPAVVYGAELHPEGVLAEGILRGGTG